MQAALCLLLGCLLPGHGTWPGPGREVALAVPPVPARSSLCPSSPPSRGHLSRAGGHCQGLGCLVSASLPPARPECQVPEVGPAQREASGPRRPCQAPTSGRREPHADGVPTRRAVPAQHVAAQPGRSRPPPWHGPCRPPAEGQRHGWAPRLARGQPGPGCRQRCPSRMPGSRSHPPGLLARASSPWGWREGAFLTGHRSCPGPFGREQKAARAAPDGFAAV